VGYLAIIFGVPLILALIGRVERYARGRFRATIPPQWKAQQRHAVEPLGRPRSPDRATV